MRIDFLLLSLVFAFVSSLGFYLAYKYGYRARKFKLKNYVLMMIAPTACCLALTFFFCWRIIELFFYSAVVGTVLEYGVGVVFQKIFHRNLWTYERFSIGGHTSYLSIPIWGVAGIVFWLLAKTIAL